jgi:hypothetical protein
VRLLTMWVASFAPRGRDSEYALCSHMLTQFKHPVHSSGSAITACLCHGKSTLPMTPLGQLSMHFQHALQSFVSSWTNSVDVRLRRKSGLFMF